MKMIRTLPTDKNGQVYYGPTTYAQAVAQIAEGRDSAEMARMLDKAGYAKIAAKIRKECNPTKAL